MLARNLDSYHAAAGKRFCAIMTFPSFLIVVNLFSHHPLAELSRNAMRTVVFSWARDDWFAALKTGLAPAAEAEIDRLENEALARGWKGLAWLEPIGIADETAIDGGVGRACAGKLFLRLPERLAFADATAA